MAPMPPPGLAGNDSWSLSTGLPSTTLELFPLVGNSANSIDSDPLSTSPSKTLDPSAMEYQPWDGAAADSSTILEEAAQTSQWPWGPSGFPAQSDDMSAAYDGIDGYNSQWSIGSPA